ncbi:MAG TPA: hypothetical protein VH988_17015 [Thermoanaerobaculia bacterium]|jgi:hypothetical protein|nr:hypothetical protein [Thermoanaerobaculia bacterium]
MQQRKGPKKLQLKLETLKQVSSGLTGKDESYSCPGCTVLTTCTPGGCNADAAERK